MLNSNLQQKEVNLRERMFSVRKPHVWIFIMHRALVLEQNRTDEAFRHSSLRAFKLLSSKAIRTDKELTFSK